MFKAGEKRVLQAAGLFRDVGSKRLTFSGKAQCLCSISAWVICLLLHLKILYAINCYQVVKQRAEVWTYHSIVSSIYKALTILWDGSLGQAVDLFRLGGVGTSNPGQRSREVRLSCESAWFPNQPVSTPCRVAACGWDAHMALLPHTLL